MQRLPLLAALAAALAVHATSATAVGFGRVNGGATLGQPLDVTISLRLDSGETLEPQCVRAAVVSGDRPLTSDQVRTRVESQAGERVIRLTTTVPLDEPVLSFDLSAGCPVRLSRQFTLFVDPPYRNVSPDTRAAVDSIPPVVRDEPAAQPAPPRRVPRRTAEPASPAPTASAAPSASAAAPRPRPPRRVAEAPPAPRPVLRLDPIEDEALTIPLLRLSTELAALPAADGASRPRFVDPEMEQRALDKERLATLEAALKRLQGVERSQQSGRAEVEAELREAQAQRYANPLVYGLVAACVLLALALLGVFWQRRRQRQRAAWWNSIAEPSSMFSADVPPEAPGAAGPAGDSADVLAAVRSREEWADEEAARRVATAPAMAAGPLPAATAAVPAPSPSFAASAIGRPFVASTPPAFDSEVDGGEPCRPMSAAELLDLEQQAEFFIVLGQDEAAIDLLMGHLRSTGGVSPLPYLKLLEIYRRRGEREPYDRMRDRFNQRFNAYAPEWDVDPEEGASLEAYPEVLGQLQAAWSTPTLAMERLDAALFKRDNGPAFDVPAYRELLFLYGVARDLSERSVEIDGVDLLLPLDDPNEQPLTASLDPASGTHDLTEAASLPADEMLSLDLDESIDDTSGLTVQRSGRVEPALLRETPFTGGSSPGTRSGELQLVPVEPTREAGDAVDTRGDGASDESAEDDASARRRKQR